MRCPECSHEQPAKLGTRCGKCRYEFVFNPKKPPYFSDTAFANAITKASANDTYYFTRNQLGGLLRRKIRESGKGQGCLIVLVGIVSIVMVAMDAGFFALIPVVIGFFTFLDLRRRRLLAADPELPSTLIDRWVKANGPIERLIETPRLHQPPPEWTEYDIYDYGVERVLIVEHDLLVDLFVLNGFHAEQRALVISESGYPHYLLPHLQRMLRERPDLPVFLLHDPSPDGQDLRRRVEASKELSLGDHPITDLGLTPKDVRRMPNLRKSHRGLDAAAIPLDGILFSTLVGGVGAALISDIAIADLLDPRRAQDDGSSGGGFG
ncbi:MAG: hypothetical protein RL885_26320 [Planctomycetota bacterium]